MPLTSIWRRFDARDIWRTGRCGLSQAQLASALGTQAPAISRIEDADYDRHSLRILRKVADYFGQHLVVTFEPKRPAASAVKRLERELVH